MQRLVLVILLIAIPLGCTDKIPEPGEESSPRPTTDLRIPVDLGPEYDRFPDRFQPVAFRGRPSGETMEGNTLEAIEASVVAGVKHVEVDFVRTIDGFVVSGHDDKLGGDCGRASRQPLEALLACTLDDDHRVITLDDVLGRPFDSVYVDFKSSDTKDDDKLLREVTAVIKAIKRSDARDRAVVMLYRTSAQVRELLEREEIRFGLKGYPKSIEGTTKMVERAASIGAELICVRVTYIDADAISFAANKGVWLLGWGTRENLPLWEKLAAAGMGGLISRLTAEAGRDIAPLWVDARTTVGTR